MPWQWLQNVMPGQGVTGNPRARFGPGASGYGPAPTPSARSRGVTSDARARFGPGAAGYGPGPAQRAMPGLPPSAKQIMQYPDGVPTGVGGGNAGAATNISKGGGPARDRKSGREDRNEAEDRQLRQSLNTRSTQPVAAAGTPMPANPVRENFWAATENAKVKEAADAAGEAAAKARYDQKMGYLSRGAGLPATSDPSQDAYWQRADMAMWAQANPELAKKQGWDPGKDYSAPPPEVRGVGPVADGEQYGADLAALEGTRGIGPVSGGDLYARLLQGQPLPPLPAGQVGPGQAAPSPAVGADAMAGVEPMPAVVGAGYTPREVQYGGPLEEDERLNQMYPWRQR